MLAKKCSANIPGDTLGTTQKKSHQTKLGLKNSAQPVSQRYSAPQNTQVSGCFNPKTKGKGLAVFPTPSSDRSWGQSCSSSGKRKTPGRGREAPKLLSPISSREVANKQAVTPHPSSPHTFGERFPSGSPLLLPQAFNSPAAKALQTQPSSPPKPPGAPPQGGDIEIPIGGLPEAPFPPQKPWKSPRKEPPGAPSGTPKGRRRGTEGKRGGQEERKGTGGPPPQPGRRQQPSPKLSGQQHQNNPQNN